MWSWKRVVVTAGAVTALVAVGGVGTAAAQAEPNGQEDRRDDRRTITVVGTGIVRGTPDIVELSLGVSTQAKTAAEALARNSELARKVRDVLRMAGVDDRGVQTSDLSVSPEYDDDGEHVIGYSASNTVTAEIEELEAAGKVVDAATEAAGNEIVVNGLYFSFDDNTDLVDAARAEAVKRARAQAEQMAEAAGVTLADLMTISETGTPVGPPIDIPAAREEGDASPTPIEPGSESLSVQVELVYEIT
jgi:uncharacterized protein